MIKMRSRIGILAAMLVLALSTLAANVETDRTWYLAGEELRVRITAGSGAIAYAELCDTEGLAAGIAVRLEEGEGTGVMSLPRELHSGYYVLSVYTRHETLVAHQLVAVINPLQKHAADDIEWVASDACRPLAVGAAEVVSEKDADIPETEGHVIKAHISNHYDGLTFSGDEIRASLSVVGKQLHYFEGWTQNDSVVLFNTYGVHGRQRVVLSAVTTTGVRLPIEMLTPFATLLPKKLPHLVFHYQRQEVETRSLAMQRRQATHEPDQPTVYDATLIGRKPDISYNLDEYRQFLTIREVLTEYVTDVTKKTVQGATRLFVLGENGHNDGIWPTLVLIDGMPVTDTERLLSYDARRVHYINIYSGQYTFGHTVYHGILSFVTRSGALTNYPTEEHMQYVEYVFP